ncbi:MAG: PAS domain S-box protein, partial [Candidatus Thermoplasmatota archaeon]|nr:PAS domain S-box protein [Candidatus Thermoplasmatota archaeon]
DRKKAETRREFASELLKVLNSPREDMDLVKTILLKIKDFTDIDAVGIRLREGDDFPYYRTSGFSEEFVEAERNLCERDTKGAIIRDSSGSPLFECMCGNILLHRTDPSKPYFTEGGSFWSNNTSYLLTTTTEEERLARTRNRCNSDGYESVALIPLRSGSEIIGLLQLNDHRIGRFTIKDIEFYEEIGSSIGVAIKRVKAGEEHRLVNEIMSNMNEGVYLINMKDIEIVWANPKFERMFGYDSGEMLGKHASIVNAPTERDPLETAKEITKVLKETGEWHGEVNNIKKDGTPFWCYANVSVFNHPFYGEVMVSVHTDITEGKIVQEELLKSERKHRTLFESMSLGVVYQNAEGYITSANPSAERILGLTLDQMQGRTSIDPRWKAIDVNGADFPGETHPSMVALKTGQKVRNIIMGVFNPIFGENTWININAVPHTKPGEDKPFQVYTVFEDITERMSAEAELQKSEERFKQFFENVPEYCYMVSLDGKIMDVNRSATNMLGYKKEDILGKPFLTTIYAPSSREIAKNLFIEWKVKGEMRNKELNIVTKDGTERTVLLSANAVRGSNGEIIHSVSIQRDITERKKAEEKVRKMSQAVEQSPALVVITDTKGDIEYVNPKFCQLTGYKTEEVMGKNPRILKSGNQTEEFYKYLWDTITAGKEWSGEFHNKKKNGELYWEFASISPIINEKGLMTHFIAIKEDVTKRKALEEKLKEYADHLEDEVKKQTNELIQSEKMASLGMLVAGVAHEVNNPLAYLKSNSNHLKQDFSQLKKILDEKKIDIDFEEFEEIIDTNLEGLDRIAQITKALKRFARPDTSGRAYV